jgi:hypothetical protein
VRRHCAKLPLAALGGTLWYFQFFFYTMGSRWVLRFLVVDAHMASIILFSTLWGFALKECRREPARTHLVDRHRRARSVDGDHRCRQLPLYVSADRGDPARVTCR